MATHILSFARNVMIINLFILPVSYAQDPLLSLLEDSMKETNNEQITKATFQAIHIVNSPTIESPAKGDLNFIIMHRFGKLNDGSYEFFGLDNAFIRLGLDYGISDRLAVGIGRSSLEKTYDGYIKYKVIQQTSGAGNIPLSIGLLAGITNYTVRFFDKPYLNARLRTTYFTQLLLARKFTRAFSLQLTPTWLHANLVPTRRDKNDLFSASLGGRLKFSRRMSITGEYHYLFPNQLYTQSLTNSLSLGIDIETGGHVFQLIFSNSRGMIAPQYIAATTGKWTKGDIYFGFNVSRNFSLGKAAKKEN